MNKKQYNNVIDNTLKHEEAAQADDSLSVARAVFDNMGVALPQGDMKTVYETIKTDNYMGWKSCTMQEAQAAANNGTAAIGISEDKIVVLSAKDEEQPVTQGASVMTLDENTSALAVVDLEYYAYSAASTNYAQLVLSGAKRFLGKTETEIESETGISLSNGQWCVDFVRLCFMLANVYHPGSNIKATSSSTDLRNWYRTNQPSRFHTGAAGIQPGDIVFVAYENDADTIRHVCIANASYNTSGYIHTINGNWSSKVQYVSFSESVPMGNMVIKSYVHPNYY